MVERKKVVFPLRVHHIQNDAALQPAHQVRAKLRFFFRVARAHCFGRGVGKRVVRQRAGIGARGFGINAKLSVHFRQKLRSIPLVRMLLTRAESIH